jgi:hypothetical protein
MRKICPPDSSAYCSSWIPSNNGIWLKLLHGNNGANANHAPIRDLNTLHYMSLGAHPHAVANANAHWPVFKFSGLDVENSVKVSGGNFRTPPKQTLLTNGYGCSGHAKNLQTLRGCALSNLNGVAVTYTGKRSVAIHGATRFQSDHVIVPGDSDRCSKHKGTGSDLNSVVFSRDADSAFLQSGSIHGQGVPPIDADRITNPIKKRGFHAAIVHMLVMLAMSEIGSAAVIQSSNRVDWVHGRTVGMQFTRPERSNLLTVTDAPYSADNTGATDATTAIQSAINAAASNDVVYLPAGVYKLNSQLTLDKSYVTLRGAGSNSVLFGAGSGLVVLKVGHDPIEATSYRIFTVTNGATKGSTNLWLTSIQNGFGDTIKAGDALRISTVTRNTGSDTFPIISVAGFDRIIHQLIVIHSRSGNTVSITAPLVWDFTNSPMLQEVDTINQPRRMVGLESFAMTMTNAGASGSSGYMIQADCLRDSWFTNLNLGFANNYQLSLSTAVNCEVTGNTIHDALSLGTSHSGLLLASTPGVLVSDNGFYAEPTRAAAGLKLYPAIEINGGVVNAAVFANFFTNCSLDIDIHNSHPLMNLIEANVFTSFFEMDGYFGSASHFTLFRNRIRNTLPIKRFNSYIQIVGNVCGNTGFDYVWSKETSGYGAPWPIFELGFPNIGNSTYEYVTPPSAWNFPGRHLTGAFGESLTNGIFTFTGTYGPTNVLWPSMGTGYFTNIPSRQASIYPILFQDGSNTNLYYGATNSGVLLSSNAMEWNATNVVLVQQDGSTPEFVTVSNGWTLYIGGQAAFQQLQSSNKYTHNFHGNLVFTNSVWALVWDDNNADHTLPSSLLYPSGMPGWWGTNRVPAIDPEAAQSVAFIPAELRYNGVAGGGDTPATPRRKFKGISLKRQ